MPLPAECKVVTNVTIAPDSSTPRTRPPKPRYATARRIKNAGKSSSGAAKYQTAKAGARSARVRNAKGRTPDDGAACVSIAGTLMVYDAPREITPQRAAANYRSEARSEPRSPTRSAHRA